MKKITKNIFLSLALLACGVTPLATSLSFGVNSDTIANTNESQIVDSDDVLEDDPVSDDDTGDSGESEPITYTYKSYYDYFIDNMDCTGVYNTNGELTNVTISAEKKAEILSYDFTGSGTEIDPYQINTTIGFWYMTKFVYSTYKYFELNCDVILNDEKFDENGNASGGDGIVYEYQDFDPTGAVINGNHHTIYGAYKNAHSVLGRGNVKKLENLNVANIYFIGSKIGGVCYSADYISNCEAKSGYIHNTSTGGVECAGVVVTAKEVVNCNNYVTLLATGTNINVGIVCTCPKITNCKNYGNINGTYSAAGISYGADKIIENCENYGNIAANNRGAVCANSWGSIVIINFINYNKEACLLFNTSAKVQIINSITYGYCFINSPNSSVYITGCKIYSNNFYGILKEYHGKDASCLLRIKNVEVYASNLQSVGFGYRAVVAGYSSKYASYEIEDVYFNITNDENYRIILLADGTNLVKFKNIYFDIRQGTKGNSNVIAYYSAEKADTNGIICNVKYDGGEAKFYYGDVSGFAQNWRTGEIVFRGRDSLGLFYSVLNDEIMSTMGYEKK